MESKMIVRSSYVVRSGLAAIQRAVAIVSALAALVAAVCLALASSARPASAAPPLMGCTAPSGYALLSKCSTANADVVIGSGECVNVRVDKASFSLGNVKILAGGTLYLPDQLAALPVGIKTKGIDVFGTLQIGAPDCAIGTANANTRVTITFAGVKPAPAVCGTPNNNPANQCPGYTKGIQVEKGGALRMYGLKGVPSDAGGVSWTYLSQAAGPPAKYGACGSNSGCVGNVTVKVPADGGNTLRLADDVSKGKGAWKKGDWIAVATTSFSPYETEFVQLAADSKASGSGSVVTLTQPLIYYHFGGTDPGPPSTANYKAGAATNFGVDERAEVGLISRNIKLTADVADTADHWGGEMRYLPGFDAVVLQGVELEKFGKEQLGSYPIHFHMDGDLRAKAAAGDVLVNANSIHHSYNKCVTIHSTQNMGVSNNVCARIAGHIFYEEVGDEYNIAFDHNLGMGALLNSFDINNNNATASQLMPPSAFPRDRDSLIAKYWWAGDNMVKQTTFNYDGLRVVNTDNPVNPTHGQCFKFDAEGKVVLIGDPASQKPANTCPNANGLFEPPSGFWIVNPSAKITNNSIAGCQDTGKAYWYVPPGNFPTGVGVEQLVKFIPVGSDYSKATQCRGLNSKPGECYGTFNGNRAHSCYQGLYDDVDVIIGDSLFDSIPLFADLTFQRPVTGEFDNFTASRIRDRAIWLRPTFFLVRTARLATNRDSVSLVTSGGSDGNYPGVWSLYSDSVAVGLSENNVDRFGPCRENIILNDVGQIGGGSWGCIDQTAPTKGTAATGGAFNERGYQTPNWNSAGYYIYDGPALIFHDRFVNFKQDISRSLTTPDAAFLKTFPFIRNAGAYEGDAALAWFNSNQSAYPTATATDELSFTNVDLRHQVFTELVNFAEFNDGDKNTAIVDLDGTLSGFNVKSTTGAAVSPISLNNLEINASSNSVDECLAIGPQNTNLELRPTANMVPSGVGQLEFESQYPPSPPKCVDDQKPGKTCGARGHSQLLTFTKESSDFDKLPVDRFGKMALHSRNGLGVWEPKVTSGYGYTVEASPYNYPGEIITPAGIPATVDVTINDIVKPGMSASNPFYVRLGICYTGTNGSHPSDPDKFSLTRGYRSYGGGGVVANDLVLRKFWNQLNGLYPTGSSICFNLDDQNPGDLTTCPAWGVSLKGNGACPPPSMEKKDTMKQAICAYEPVKVNRVDFITDLTVDKSPNGKPFPDKFFYDKTTGMLFFYVMQGKPNAPGPSPLGICDGSANEPSFCPDKSGESYYLCPAEGCTSYRVTLNDSTYVPEPSQCDTVSFRWPAPPANQDKLVLAGTSTEVKQVQKPGKANQFPYYEWDPTTAPKCPLTTP
jgi:hypothetical protein